MPVIGMYLALRESVRNSVETLMNEGNHNKGLNFKGFRGYYGYMSYNDGYGGFNYSADFLYMNQSTWTNANGVGYQSGWCDTGYQNVAAMSHAKSLGWIYQYGVMESANGHSFTLKSMNVAASFSNDAVWDIISYTESNGQLQVKAVDPITVSYTGDQLKLATIGQPGDFRNIAAVAFQMVSYGNPGNSCTYGYPVFGVQLAIGDVRVAWSNTAALDDVKGKLRTPWLLHHASHAGPHPGAADPHAGAHQHNEGDQGQPPWPAHDSHAAAQFHLPAMDHFF
jgi:hypothetical protein